MTVFIYACVTWPRKTGPLAENPHYVDWGVAGASLSDVSVTDVLLTNRKTLFVERGGETYCLCVFPAPYVTGCLTDGFQLAMGAYISCQRLWSGKLAGLKTGFRLERFLAFMLLFSRTWPTSAFTSEWQFLVRRTLASSLASSLGITQLRVESVHSKKKKFYSSTIFYSLFRFVKGSTRWGSVLILSNDVAIVRRSRAVLTCLLAVDF